jgi:hypothetical protein
MENRLGEAELASKLVAYKRSIHHWLRLGRSWIRPTSNSERAQRHYRSGLVLIGNSRKNALEATHRAANCVNEILGNYDAILAKGRAAIDSYENPLFKSWLRSFCEYVELKREFWAFHVLLISTTDDNVRKELARGGKAR